jgi:hypothetical protein
VEYQQKGPFLQGETVKAIKLNTDGTESNTFDTTVIGSDYKFSFSDLTWDGPTKFTIENGKYYNEVTGATSTATLSAIENIEEGTTPNVNINILTDIAAKNILSKMAETPTSDIDTYKDSAQDAIAETFNLDLGDGVDLEDLDLTGQDTENEKANTQLLQLSAAILSTNNPDEVITNLGNDLSDGDIDDEALGSLEEIQDVVEDVDLVEIAAKMETSLNLTNVPNSNDLLDGTLSLKNDIAFTSVTDAHRNTEYTASTTIDGIYGTGGADFSISNADEYRIDGGEWIALSTSSTGSINNGQTFEVKHTSSTTYETSKTTEVTIAGVRFPFSTTTLTNPVVSDTIPNEFDFGFKKGESSGATVESSEITVSGINETATIFIDYGTFTKTAALDSSVSAGLTSDTVENGDKIKVTHIASSEFSGSRTSIVNIGGVEGKFKSFTLAQDINPILENSDDEEVVSFDNNFDEEISATSVSNTITVTSITGEVDISIENGEYKIGDGAYTSEAGTVELNETVTVKHTSSSSFTTETSSTLTIGNRLVDFTSLTMANPIIPDDIPNEFSFDALTSEELNREVTGVFTLSGTSDANASISISSNGAYRYSSDNGLNWSAWSSISANDLIPPKALIEVKHTTSSDFGTQTKTTLTVGGVSADFISFTKAEDALVDDFTFSTQSEVDQNSLFESATETISGINTSVPVSIENGEYSIDGAAYTSTAGTISNGQTLKLRHTSASSGASDTISKVKVGAYTTTFTTTTAYTVPNISDDITDLKDPVLLGEEYSYQPVIESDSGEVLEWSVSELPTWAKFNEFRGEIYGTPNSSEDVNADINDITITATNPAGTDTVTIVDLTVGNAAPEFSEDSITSASKTKGNSFSYTFTFEDIGSDTHTFSLVGEPDFVTIDVNTGELTNSSTTDSSDVGTHTFNIKVSDDKGGEDTLSFSLTITEFSSTASVPTISGTPDISVVQGGTYSFIPDANDSNSADLTFTIQNKPSWATFSETTGELSGTPENSEVGVYNNIIISVTEASDTVSLSAFNIEVTNVNDAPTVATEISDTTVNEDEVLSLDIKSNFTDIDLGDSLTYTYSVSKDGLTVSPDWLSFSNGVFSGTPANKNIGEYEITVTARDKSVASVSDAFTLTVANVNDAPILATTGIPEISVDEDSQLSDLITSDITSHFEDLDEGDNLTFSATLADGSDLPSWLSLTNGVFSGIPLHANLGTISIEVTATDDASPSASVSDTFDLTVVNVNDDPTGTVTITGTATEDQTLTADTSAIADEDGIGTFTYQWKAAGTDITGATSSTYVLTQAEVGKVVTVTISYTDNQGTAESVTSEATSAVANVNDAPTGAVTVTGTVSEDETLTAVTSTIADEDGLGTFTYQWKANGTDITGATSSTYVLRQAEVGKAITVTVSYTDGYSEDESLTSEATSAVVNVNDAPTGAVTIDGTLTQNETLSAVTSTITDEDGLGAFTYQWKAAGTDITGANSGNICINTSRSWKRNLCSSILYR